jgi:hypothetical protein
MEPNYYTSDVVEYTWLFLFHSFSSSALPLRAWISLEDVSDRIITLYGILTSATVLLQQGIPNYSTQTH